MLLHKGNQVWIASQAMVTLCTKPLLRAQEAAFCFTSPILGEIYSLKSQVLLSWMKMLWIFFPSLGWIYIATMMLQNSCLWCLWNSHYAMVFQTCYVLISPKLKRRMSYAKSDNSSMENMFGVPFKQWKVPAPDQFSESKRQVLVFFP